MKTSKIKQVQGAGEKNGWLNYDIDLEDGTSGSKGFKTEPNHLTVGVEVEYEMHPDYPQFFKTLKTKGYTGKPKKQQGSNASFALSYAKDWCLGIHNAGEPRTTADVLAVADKFKEWLDQN